MGFSNTVSLIMPEIICALFSISLIADHTASFDLSI